MTTEEITKEIIVSMIEKGHFDGLDDNANQEARRINRTNFICKTYSAIAKTVDACKGGNYE